MCSLCNICRVVSRACGMYEKCEKCVKNGSQKNEFTPCHREEGSNAKEAIYV